MAVVDRALVPVLMSSFAVQLEHFVLSDTTVRVFVMIATAVMLWRQHPPAESPSLLPCQSESLPLDAPELDD